MTARNDAGYQFLFWLVLVFALLSAAIGVVSLSQATIGVGFVGCACLLAIVARLVQAARYRP